MKRKVVKAALIFFAVILVCTFFSRTVYYFTLPKVSYEQAKAATFTETAALYGGSVEPEDTVVCYYEPPVPVRIVEIYAEPGDEVEQGDRLISFDTAELSEQIDTLKKQRESAEIALLEFRRSFSARVTSLEEQIPSGSSGGELGIYAPGGGTVSGVTLSKNDMVYAGGELCSITDTSRLSVTAPFSAEFKVTEGMAAEVALPSHMEIYAAAVSRVGNVYVDGGMRLVDVTVTFENPGVLSSGDLAGVTLAGGVLPAGDGVTKYEAVSIVEFPAAGKLTELYVSDGDAVEAGARLCTVEVSGGAAAEAELEYMLSTGIYGGKTEKQLTDALSEIDETIAAAEALAAEPYAVAAESGTISSFSVSRRMSFSEGALYEYTPENAGYRLVFTEGEMGAVETGQSCDVICVSGGWRTELRGRVVEKTASQVTVECSGLSEYQGDSESFDCEVEVAEHSAALTLPLSAMSGSGSVYVVNVESGILGDSYVLELREVVTGQVGKSRVEIISGITARDNVVVAWDRALDPGAAVDVVG